MAGNIIVRPNAPMLAIAAMTEIANQAGNEPWPSLELASKWFDRASIVLSISLLFGFASTVVIVWLGIVKEHHWDLARDHAAERIVSLELETAKANEEISKANKVAALATQKANEAALELEKFKAPRVLSPEQIDRIAEKLKQFSGVPYEVATATRDPEFDMCISFIETALGKAGWIGIGWRGDPDGDMRGVGRATIGRDVSATNVMIAISPGKTTPPLALAAAKALASALNAEGIAARAGAFSVPTDNIRIMVGRKT